MVLMFKLAFIIPMISFIQDYWSWRREVGTGGTAGQTNRNDVLNRSDVFEPQRSETSKSGRSWFRRARIPRNIWDLGIARLVTGRDRQ
jgi:hypothetical protein